MKQITAMLIDSDTQSVSAVNLNTVFEDGTYQTIDSDVAELIGCGPLDMVSLDDRHAIYLDDEGLREDGVEQAFTDIDGVHHHLAGRLVVVGYDAEADTHFDAEMTEGELRAKVSFFRGVVKEMKVETIGDRIVVSPVIESA